MHDDLPGDELEETRAALAPTLDATAAILPWVAKPRALRFDSKLNARWVEAFSRLTKAWSGRHGEDGHDLRPAIFALYGIALETADADCLHLGEALASAADQLEITPGAPMLLAAMSAATESLGDTEGLEHVLFPERARYSSSRLEQAITAANSGSKRSSALDQLFVSEAGERLERMRDALDVLPLDAYALKLEANELAQHAEQLELFGIVHLCREFLRQFPVGGEAEILDTPGFRDLCLTNLAALTKAIAAVNT